MAEPKPGDLDRRITFQAKGVERDAALNTVMEGDWAAIANDATVWAEVQDVMPSRGEASGDGIDTARRPARIRLWWRDDVDSSMRIVVWAGDPAEEIGTGDRVMQIVSGPAEIFGRRKWMELMAEEYSSAEGVA